MSDWWAKKLQKPQEAPQPARPPVTGRQPQYVPQAAPQRPLPQAGRPLIQYEEPPATLSEAVARGVTTRGGEGTREQQQLGGCPRCGSANYSQRPGPGSTIMNERGQRAGAAPHCFECGYNGLFDMGQAPTG